MSDHEDRPDIIIPPDTSLAVRERAAEIDRRRATTLALEPADRLARDAARRLEKAKDPITLAPGTPLAEWEEKFLEGVRALGTVRAGCSQAGIPRADVEICFANNSQFRAKFELARKDYAEGLLLKADEFARAGDGPMMRALLAAYLPEMFGKTANTVNITISDRKEIEKIAREYGVDPKVAIETTYQIINNQKGQDQQ